MPQTIAAASVEGMLAREKALFVQRNPNSAALAGKTAAIISASPGALGGLRGLVHLRSILGNIQILVLPDQISIPTAHEAFASDGSLKDAKKQDAVSAIGRKLAETAAKLAR